MSNDELTDNIVAFVRQCGHATDPASAARSRGWLDEHDRPTHEGRALIETLMQQTRYGAYRLVG
ncbi:hypothetical protein SAMN05444722_0966 [Rhodovulum sp. ES.010]|uniref:hypothetical protein n=1 Tax=Rhodovulum sp. ES.010 TaxID=1882821 RepID=UPI00092BC7D7|nr:hypothetical protein [Rhodovulum sp. ES.010]SIO23984.1 hypothetical protein SAMN05444722_0966 [Rhodovulum sp. ES.010]